MPGEKENRVASSKAAPLGSKIVEEVIKPDDVPETQAAPVVEVAAGPVEKSMEKQVKIDISEAGVEKEEPCFVLKLQDGQVTEGECIKLTAKATGVPKPEFVWFKDEKRLNFNDRVKTYEEDDAIVLEIGKAELEDEGDYICIAKNDVGEVESVAELLVDGMLLIFISKFELRIFVIYIVRVKNLFVPLIKMFFQID